MLHIKKIQTDTKLIYMYIRLSEIIVNIIRHKIEKILKNNHLKI